MLWGVKNQSKGLRERHFQVWIPKEMMPIYKEVLDFVADNGIIPDARESPGKLFFFLLEGASKAIEWDGKRVELRKQIQEVEKLRDQLRRSMERLEALIKEVQGTVPQAGGGQNDHSHGQQAPQAPEIQAAG